MSHTSWAIHETFPCNVVLREGRHSILVASCVDQDVARMCAAAIDMHAELSKVWDKIKISPDFRSKHPIMIVIDHDQARAIRAALDKAGGKDG